MKIAIIITLTTIAIAIQIAQASFMQGVATMKGHGSEVHAFALCLLFGIFGWVYVAALPDKVQQEQNRLQQEQNKKIIELLEARNNDNMPKV